MIRRAKTLDDVRMVTVFMTQFEQASEFVKVDVEHAISAYWGMIGQGIADMLILEQDGEMIGGLGALTFPDLHDGKKTAVETFWFVAPEHRGRGLELLEAFESWGRERGCQRLAMIHLTDSFPKALERLYRMKGYRLVEKHYTKEIEP